MAMSQIQLKAGQWIPVSTGQAKVSFSNPFRASALPEESIFVYEAASAPSVPGSEGDEITADERYEAVNLTGNLYVFVYGNDIELTVQRG